MSKQFAIALNNNEDVLLHNEIIKLADSRGASTLAKKLLRMGLIFMKNGYDLQNGKIIRSLEVDFDKDIPLKGVNKDQEKKPSIYDKQPY